MSNLPGYIIISLRNIYREKLYAFINLAGLSVSIACCLVLALYLKSELSYDQHFEGHENIYRIVEEFNNKGQVDAFARTGSSLGHMMQQEFPEVLDYVVFQPNPSQLLTHGESSYFWDNTYTVTPNVFKVFRHSIIFGDPETALTEIGDTAISASVARRYFGTSNPIGEILYNDLNRPLKITLVFADLPDNTHLKYDLLTAGNMHTPLALGNEAQQRQRLWQTPHFTYLLMADAFNPDNFAAMQAAFYVKHMTEIGSPGGMSMRFWLQPLAAIHHDTGLQRDLPTGNMAYVYAFSTVALFIMAIACINYMNLATARSIRRAREVGMRKILGARRSMLMLQFMTEALLFVFIAMLLGLVFVEVLLTLTDIELLLGKTLDFRVSDEPELLLLLFVFCLTVGLLSGLYPAFYLSSWAPLAALVSNTSNTRSNITLRLLLVLVQFTISIAVVSGTLLMARQINFLNGLGLGFDKENRLVINLVGSNVIQQLPVIKEELLLHRNILGVTAHDGILGSLENMGAMPVEMPDGSMASLTINVSGVDEDFFAVMGMELVAGRDFSQRLLTDVGRSFIVNQTFADSVGWDQPLGKRILDGRVIGVLKDFHFQSLHNAIDPIAFTPFADDFANLNQVQQALMQRKLTVSLSPEELRETLAYLQVRFAEFDPKHPFTYEFLDASLAALYESEANLTALIGLFAGICICLACLGLFGLSSYTTEQRSREMSIRKVLGATTEQIIRLLSWNVLMLILAGGLIATILAWLVINEWLLSFAYRIDIGWTAFALAILLALVVAYLTVALQSWKTAVADPVAALRRG